MKTAVALLCTASVAAALPFGFGGQASGNAQGTVNQAHSVGPYGTQHLTQTSSVAGGKSVGGAPSYSSAHASSGKGLGGTSFANTGASSVQPGASFAQPGLFGAGFPGFAFGGAPFGFPGFGSQATGTAQGAVSEAQSYGPQGFTHITNTGSTAGGTSINGAPSYNNAHASNQQGPGGVSVSNTGASSVQPGFNAGHFRGRPSGIGGFGGRLH